VIAADHCSGVFARKPVFPCTTMSQFIPTGFATTGKPAAIY
jgi:hypothetical protein